MKNSLARSTSGDPLISSFAPVSDTSTSMQLLRQVRSAPIGGDRLLTVKPHSAVCATIEVHMAAPSKAGDGAAAPVTDTSGLCAGAGREAEDFERTGQLAEPFANSHLRNLAS